MAFDTNMTKHECYISDEIREYAQVIVCRYYEVDDLNEVTADQIDEVRELVDAEDSFDPMTQVVVSGFAEVIQEWDEENPDDEDDE